MGILTPLNVINLAVFPIRDPILFVNAFELCQHIFDFAFYNPFSLAWITSVKFLKPLGLRGVFSTILHY